MNGLSHGVRDTLAHCNLSRTVAWEVLWVRIFFAANRALPLSRLSSLLILRQVRGRRHRVGGVSTRVGQLLHGSIVDGPMGTGRICALRRLIWVASALSSVERTPMPWRASRPRGELVRIANYLPAWPSPLSCRRPQLQSDRSDPLTLGLSCL